jgi:hypothetical protein
MNEFTRRLPEGCQRSKTLHLGANHPVSHKALYRYLDVVEAQLASPRNPTLCFVWTPSLAARIKKGLPPSANCQLVHLHFSDSDAERSRKVGRAPPRRTLMATYGSNSLAVRFQRNIVDEPLPENKSQEMPAHRPMVGSFMPGENVPLAGRRYPKSLRSLPWKSWLSKSRPGIKRKKRSNIGSLMGS